MLVMTMLFKVSMTDQKQMVIVELASSAMGTARTVRLPIILFDFSGHSAAQTLTFDSMWLPIQ